MRRTLLLILKVLVSLLLLYLALRSVHLGATLERLSGIDPGWMLAALFLCLAQTGLLAVRWQAIVRRETDTLTVAVALQISLIAMFFGQVLPASLGADALRVWLLGRRGSGWAIAGYSVLIDRVVGVAALALIVVGCLPWSFALLQDPVARTGLALLGAGALGAAILFFLLGFIRLPIIERLSVTRHAAAASRMAQRLFKSASATITIAGCSFVCHALTVAIAYACARAVAAPIGFLDLLFLLPPVILIATVPISIAGWGVRETSMVVAFGYAGLAPGDGLLLSVLFGLTNFAVGAMGGLIWIASGVRDLKLRSAALPLES